MLILTYSGGKIPEELKAEETIAFTVCDSDSAKGLTWAEVKSCEDTFAEAATAHNFYLPTEDDFKSADLNRDGTLLFEEWEEWVMKN